MNIKLPLLVAAASVILSSGAFAGSPVQSYDKDTEVSVDSSGTVLPVYNASLTDDNDIEGVMVQNPQGITIGDIDRVVQDKSGNKLAIIGLSRSLKEVAVPLDELHWKENGSHIFVINASKAELEEQKDIDPYDYEKLNPADYDKYEFSRLEEKISEVH